LAGSGALALSLVGCGSDGDGGSQESSEQGLLSKPVDTSNQAKPGGILQSYQSSNITTLDMLPAPNDSTGRTASGYIYSRLMKFKPGYLALPTGEIEPDAAESWEITGDKLQITFKLRQDVKYDQRAPTNGRQVMAKDVLFSWDKYTRLSSLRGDLWNNPPTSGGPVQSMTAPDDRTVVVKLAFPDSIALPLLASASIFCIQPVEADGGFDPRVDARGSGPFILEKNVPSVGIEYRRNPNWYRKDRPFLDGISLPIVPEYATQLAAFKAQNIWAGPTGGGGPVRQEDILSTKQDLPALRLRQGEYPYAASRLFFGHLPATTPFKDERVRQALSMMIDRDTVTDVLLNVSNFRNAGLEAEIRWHSAIPAGWEGFWLNPKSKDFGPNAQYYQLNLPEARKLLAAAGYATGFEFELNYNPSGPGSELRYAEILNGMLQEGGIRPKMSPRDSGSEFVPNYARGKNNFSGIAVYGSSPYVDPVAFVSSYYHSGGAFAPDLKPFAPEPDIDQMIDNMHREFDLNKRMALVHEFQRIMAKRLRILLAPGAIAGYGLSWPFVGNSGAFVPYNNYSAPTESTIHIWYDESKRT
jgi:ABC-type transport system substrate-binding protein